MSRLPKSHLLRSLDEYAEMAVSLRRVLHERPDLSGSESPTRELLLEHVPGSASIERVADTGALVRIGPPGPCVAVRAELDALPIIEDTGVPWSAHHGAMHACGHDVHMAAAVLLANAVRDHGPTTPLLLVLQPREETSTSGAKDILEAGALDRHDVRSVVGAHVQPLLGLGQTDCASGAVNASADEFDVTIRGVGGHAAYPHLGSDCVLAIAHFVTAVQQLVARETDPMDAAVVSVGELRAGTSPNVRPATATACGTIRATSASHRAHLIRRLDEIARGSGMVSGCEVSFVLKEGEPALVNDQHLADEATDLLTASGVSVSQRLRSCGADDFAHYGTRFPSLMMFVGTGDASGRLHSPTFLPPERSVGDVAAALAAGYLAAANQIVSERDHVPAL